MHGVNLNCGELPRKRGVMIVVIIGLGIVNVGTRHVNGIDDITKCVYFEKCLTRLLLLLLLFFFLLLFV